jgi:hypothetical protein
MATIINPPINYLHYSEDKTFMDLILDKIMKDNNASVRPQFYTFSFVKEDGQGYHYKMVINESLDPVYRGTIDILVPPKGTPDNPNITILPNAWPYISNNSPNIKYTNLKPTIVLGEEQELHIKGKLYDGPNAIGIHNDYEAPSSSKWNRQIDKFEMVCSTSGITFNNTTLKGLSVARPYITFHFINKPIKQLFELKVGDLDLFDDRDVYTNKKVLRLSLTGVDGNPITGRHLELVTYLRNIIIDYFKTELGYDITRSNSVYYIEDMAICKFRSTKLDENGESLYGKHVYDCIDLCIWDKYFENNKRLNSYDWYAVGYTTLYCLNKGPILDLEQADNTSGEYDLARALGLWANDWFIRYSDEGETHDESLKLIKRRLYQFAKNSYSPETANTISSYNAYWATDSIPSRTNLGVLSTKIKSHILTACKNDVKVIYQQGYMHGLFQETSSYDKIYYWDRIPTMSNIREFIKELFHVILPSEEQGLYIDLREYNGYHWVRITGNRGLAKLLLGYDSLRLYIYQRKGEQ